MNYHHLLVPVDLNDPGGLTIETAIEMARQHHARTTLMYVIESIATTDDDEDDDPNGFESFFAELEAQVRQRLAPFVHRFEQAGLVARAEVMVGHAPREIVQYSASNSVDLVVMRSERVDLARPFENLTTFSHQVSLFCQCPVMLVK